MDQQTLTRYVGDYDHFQEVYAVKKAQLEAAYNRQQQEISELKDFVARNKARVATRNMAMSRQKKLDKMDVIELAKEKPKPEFRFRMARTPGRYIFQTKDLVIGYGEPLSKPLCLSMERGEKIVLTGANGIGKTTLLNCISCYIPFDEGEITLGGKSLAGQNEAMLAKIRNEKLGFVFQDFMLLDGLTIRENILVPRIVQGAVSADAEMLADELVSLFGIGHIMDKYPAEISGGEKQRAAVARSLINNPLMILADEPTGNLDSKSSRAVIEAFGSAREKMQATIFMVTHDSFAASFCDRVILFKDGVIYRQLENSRNGSIQSGSAQAGNRKSRREFQDELLSVIKEMSE